MEKYKKENQASIMKNRQKLVIINFFPKIAIPLHPYLIKFIKLSFVSQQLRDEQIMRSKLELEKAELEVRNRRLKEEELEALKSQKRHQESLIDELVMSNNIV